MPEITPNLKSLLASCGPLETPIAVIDDAFRLCGSNAAFDERLPNTEGQPIVELLTELSGRRFQRRLGKSRRVACLQQCEGDRGQVLFQFVLRPVDSGFWICEGSNLKRMAEERAVLTAQATHLEINNRKLERLVSRMERSLTNVCPVCSHKKEEGRENA